MSSRRKSTAIGVVFVALAALAVGSLSPTEPATPVDQRVRPRPLETGAILIAPVPSSATTPLVDPGAGALSVTEADPTALFLRDGEPGPGRLLATPVGDDGAPTGRVIELVADEAGRLALSALCPGWWRVESPARGDSIVGGYWYSTSPPKNVTGHSAWVLLPWQVTGRPHDPTVAIEPAEDPTDVLIFDVASPVPLHGRVIDDATEAAVPDSFVDLVQDGAVRGSAPVGPDGSFSFSRPRHEVVRAQVLARAAGWASACAWELDGGQPLVLRLRRGAMAVEGQVVDVDGSPTAATVEVLTSDASCRLRLPGVSGPDGRFRIDGVPTGLGGVGPRCTRVRIEARTVGGALGARTHVLPSSAPVQLVVRRPAKLLIFALDADGMGLQGHAGEAELLEPRDDPDLRSMQLYGEGTRLEWSCWEDSVVTVTVGADGHLPRRLVVRLPVAPIRLRLERGSGAVRGTVVDQAGQPLARAGLMLEWSIPAGPGPSNVRRGEVLELPGTFDRQHLGTDDGGAFSFEGVPSGARFSVEASKHEFLPDRRDDVSSGAVLRFVLAPRPPHAPAVFKLRATDAGTGAAVCDELRVRIERPLETATRRLVPGSTGFSLNEPGPLRLQLEGTGWIPSPVLEVEAVLGTTVDLGDVPLARAGSMRLTIGGWPAGPVLRLRARWSDPDGRARESIVASDAAEWLLEGVAPGQVTLHVEALGPGDAVVQRALVVAVVRIGQRTDVSIDLGGD